MRTIHFLTSPSVSTNDNHERLPAAFTQHGWNVHTHDHEALSIVDGQVKLTQQTIHPSDWIWPLGFGPAENFADRQQILLLIPATQFVVPPLAWTTLHGKPAWLEYCVPTLVSGHEQQILDYARTHSGPWVIKPSGASYGANVSLIQDVQALATHLADASTDEKQIWVLQQYIPEIASGETRTLICAGKIIGSYLRVPTDGFKANLAHDATPHRTQLDQQTQTLVAQVLGKLEQQGVHFAAIDTVGGYLMEVNLANPGGLATLQTLYGNDPAAQVVESIQTLPRD